MRIGDVEIRPLGGGPGCLLMILISLVASVVLTIALNFVLRLF
jgi:hypothetical protein